MEEQNQNPIQEPKEENVVEQATDGPKFTPLGEIKEKAPKKKKSKVGAIIFILLLILGLIGGIAYYYYDKVYTNPKLVYQQIIKSAIDGLDETAEEMTTIKANAKLDMDVNLNEDYMQDGVQEILDLINNIEATVEMQMDTNEKKALVKLNSNYENEELLNCDMLIDAKNKGTYVKLEQFFDNILEIEMEDEYYEELETALEIDGVTEEQKFAQSKAIGILKEELSKIIKDEYCSKEGEKITINSKEIQANKYILKMTYSEFMNELKTTIESLKNNEEFLNCYENKEEGKEKLETALNEIENITMEEEATLYVKLYRTGLKQEFARVDFEIECEGQKLIFKIENAEEGYKFELTFEDETYCTGTIASEQVDEKTSKLNIKVEASEIGTIALNMEYGYVLNEAIDAMDTENSVKIEEVSEGDLLKAYGELENSKLYEIVEELVLISEDSDMEYTEIEIPDISENGEQISDIEKNISSNVMLTDEGAFIVFLTNNNEIAVDMDIEVEYYDEDGMFLGSCTEDYLMGIGAGREIAVEMTEVPDNFATYKIYVDAEDTIIVKEYFEEVEIEQQNNNGKNIVVQVRNNSKFKIENMSVCVLYYNAGKIVGIATESVCDVKSGRTGNFTLDYPYNQDFEEIEFDHYKVIVTQAYSYVY